METPVERKRREKSTRVSAVRDCAQTVELDTGGPCGSGQVDERSQLIGCFLVASRLDGRGSRPPVSKINLAGVFGGVFGGKGIGLGSCQYRRP
jgi:hypothetical protein